MKVFWIVCGVVTVLVAFVVLCWVSSFIFDYSAVAQATDDLSREQQVEVMRECYNDARGIVYDSGTSIMGTVSDGKQTHIGRLAVAFFEYRTRGR